ncbi:MAG: hypothetical protein WD877_00710 [Candidatus Saccharimonadales bacterium]
MKPENEPKTNQPERSIAWTASEYIDHTRGASWYSLLVLATVVLTAGVWLMTKDYFATAVVAIVGIIVGIFASKKPRQISYELTSSGLKAGEKFYAYNLFKSFAVIRDGALNSVNLFPAKRFMPPISAYYEPQDEEAIIDAIGQHLPYEERSLDGIDKLSRRLRF